MADNTTLIISIIAIIISLLSLSWSILATIYSYYSHLKISLISTIGLKISHGEFKSDNNFQLLIRNNSPRENGIIEYLYFRDGWSFENGDKKMIEIPRWSIYSLQLNVSSKVPFPAFIILQDFNERYYLIRFLDKDSGKPAWAKEYSSKNYLKIEKRLSKYNDVT